MTQVQSLITDGLAVSVGDNPGGEQTLLKLADPERPAAMTIATSAALGHDHHRARRRVDPGDHQRRARRRADAGTGRDPVGHRRRRVALHRRRPGRRPGRGGVGLHQVPDQRPVAVDVGGRDRATSRSARTPSTSTRSRPPYATDPRFKVAYDQVLAGPDDLTAVGPVIGPLPRGPLGDRRRRRLDLRWRRRGVDAGRDGRPVRSPDHRLQRPQLTPSVGGAVPRTRRARGAAPGCRGGRRDASRHGPATQWTMLRATDDHRRARIARRHGVHPEPPVRRHHRCHDGDDRAARHRAVDAAPEPARSRALESPSTTSRPRSTTRGRSSSRWRCGGRCSSSPGSCCRPWSGAPGGGSPRPSAGGSAREAVGPGRPRRGLDRGRVGGRSSNCLTGRELSARELRDTLTHVGGTFVAAPGTKWSAEVPTMTRLLTILTAAGDVVRGHNAGHWRISRPDWTSMTSWLGEAMTTARLGARVRRGRPAVLWTFGPATEADLVWWLGSTKAAVRQALSDVGRGRRWRWTTDRPDGCGPMTPPTWLDRLVRTVGGAAADARSDDDGLAGAGRSTSTRRTRRTCSTPWATAGRRCGWTGASSGAGSRTSDERVRPVLMEDDLPGRSRGCWTSRWPASTSSSVASTSRTCSRPRR